MITPSTEQPAQREARTQLILWVALLGSVAMYAAVGLFVLGDRGGAGPAPVLVYALAGVAVMQTGLAFLLPGLIPGMAPQQRNILRWALAESVGILGLVLRGLGASTGIFLGFLGWSALLLIVLQPRGGVEEKRVN